MTAPPDPTALSKDEAMSDLFGTPIVTSSALPIRPTPGVWARRYVRHGLVDVLTWLGEDVGPKPDDETHALMIGGTMHASAALVGKMRIEAAR